MIDNTKISFKKKFFTMSIILIPFLQQYAFFFKGIGMGEVLLLGYFIISLRYMYLFDSKKLLLHPLFLLFIWIIISGLFSNFFQVNFNHTGFFTLTLRLFYYLVIGIIGIPLFFNYNYGLLVYKVASFFFTTYLFLQIIFYKIFGVILPWYMSWLPLNMDYSYYTVDFVNRFSDFFRPYSLFTEPGLYAQFILPYFIILLFSQKKNNKFEMGYLMLGMIFSTSGQGIMFLIIVMTVYFIYEIFMKRDIYYIIIIPLAIALFMYASKLEMVSRSLNRLFGENSSSQLRIFNGYNIFKEIPIFYQTIGVGYNNLSTFVLETYPMNIEGMYVNSISNIAICTGVIGMVIAMSFFLDIFKYKRITSKVLLMQLLISCFVSNVFLSSTMLIYFALIFGEENSFE